MLPLGLLMGRYAYKSIIKIPREILIPIIIFFALLLIPLLIGFRDMLPDYIPAYFRDLLITTEENKPQKSVARV